MADDSYTFLVLFIDGRPVFKDDKTRDLIPDLVPENLVAFNLESFGGWEPSVYQDISRATHGFWIEMCSHDLMDNGSLVSNIGQIFLLGVVFKDHSFEYVFISMVDPPLLPDYHLVLRYSTLEYVKEKAKYSMVVTEVVVEGEPNRGHGRHILVYT